MSHTCWHVSELPVVPPPPCNVAVANVTFDPFTCALSIEGAGGDGYQYSIDGTTWFDSGDFIQCFDEGQVVNTYVRDLENIACSSTAFPYTITEKIILFIGNKNTLDDGLGDDKEGLILSALVAAGYTIHYVKAGDVKNDFLTIDDMYAAGHECVKAVVNGPDSKDTKDSTIMSWDIPLVFLGNKDVFQDLGFGLDQNEEDSSPKDFIQITTNTDPSGIGAGFTTTPPGIQISTEEKKFITIEPTGDMTVIGNIDGDADQAAVWYVDPGENYGAGTSVNYVIGIGFEKDHGKTLTGDGATLIVQATDFAYANRATCN